MNDNYHSTCASFIEALQRELDGEPSQLSEGNWHAAICPGCRAWWEFVQALKQYPAHGPLQRTLSKDFSENLIHQALARDRIGGRKVWQQAPSVFAATLLVFLTSGFLLRWSVDSNDGRSQIAWAPTAVAFTTRSRTPGAPVAAYPGDIFHSVVRRHLNGLIIPASGTSKEMLHRLEQDATDEWKQWRKPIDAVYDGAAKSLDPIGRSTLRALTLVAEGILPKSDSSLDSSETRGRFKG